MDFDAKLGENMAPQYQQLMSLSAENCLKPFMKDEFPFDTTPSLSSKGYDYNMQDFHHLEHHQVHVSGSSSNPAFGIQTACYDPFDAFPYGCSTNNAVDLFECKPFADNVGRGQVMDNFQGGGGYWNLSQRNSDDVMEAENIGYMPFDYQEMKPVNLVVPDEVSCATAVKAYYKKVGMNKNRGLASTRRTWKERKKSNVVKGQWTTEEDRLLIQLVEQYGVKKWCLIAQMLPGRIGKQCRERWHNHLRPDIKKDTWSEGEDKVLIQAHKEIGNKWAEIAKRLPGRTENSIKNHWNATKRRQFSKRKCRPKYPRGSILQEYIKSLNLDQSSYSTRYQEKSSNGTNGSADMNTSTKASNYQPQTLDFCPSTDRLVPEYDFNEVPDFSFDEKLLQESCSIDSLLDEIPSAPHVADAADPEQISSFEINVPVDMAPGMGTEVKKELDLVEMISHQAIM